MKKSKLLSCAVVFLGMGAFVFAGCGGGGGGGPIPSTKNPSAFPTAVDKYETPLGSALADGGGDDSLATASSISVGGRQYRTLFPAGDVDWVEVDLEGGVAYEISVNDLSVNADSYMYLKDAEGFIIVESDDYINYDSNIYFEPRLAGTYYVQVMTYDAYEEYDTPGVLSYTLRLNEFVDGDGDTVSSLYDCNDADPLIYPYNDDSGDGGLEIEGDGIDQDCDGFDLLSPAQMADADAAEPDNTFAQAKLLREVEGSVDEVTQRSELQANFRTMHAAEEEDFFKFKVPAFGYVESDVYVSAGMAPGFELFDAAQISIPFSEFDGVFNESATSQTYYLKALDGGDVAFYVPMLIPYGIDADDDGYYSQDWATDWDCDDGNADIYPGATEDAADDGVDQDCDGTDAQASPPAV